MKFLSRNDLEAIGARVITAYKKLPAVSGQTLERVDIDYLCQALLGLRIDYARLSLGGEKIGLTSLDCPNLYGQHKKDPRQEKN